MSEMAADMLEEYVGRTNELEQKVKDLEAQVATLQQQLKVARATIEEQRQQSKKRWNDSRDYLDYEDDRR